MLDTSLKRKADMDFGNSILSSKRPAKAQKQYYGIDIHQLLEEAEAEAALRKTVPEAPIVTKEASRKPSLLWTEKYRAKRFTDLIGDERTHRNVMHWLKRWDPIVYPGSFRAPKKTKGDNAFEEKPHRKILMLTGPPGLGKTTLAHVCAKQAGYEVQEINASDERSSAVVKGRIRDMVGTENVKGVDNKGANGAKKAAKPVCVIVDEVDGVVSGSGGEGGFMKALVDLIMLDQKNSNALSAMQQAPAKKKKKGDRFRLLRPIILVCNDIYHPSLRPLRQSLLAEVIHVRKPPVQSLVTRMHNIFEKEGIPCDGDGVRRLCEATWGVSNRKEDRNGNGAGEGDMRGILVVGEWVAGKLRVSGGDDIRLTRKWVEDNVLSDLQHGGGAARGLGRGGPKDIVERVFKEGAGFPQSSAKTPLEISGINSVKGVAEGQRRVATQRLREIIDTQGDTDRIMTDCFAAYPEHPFQDDTMLSKPDAAYEWLNFHDRLSGAVFSSNEWELAPYLSTPILGFHHLFASSARAQYVAGTENDDDKPAVHPLAGPNASWAAHEAEKQNSAHVQALQSALSLPLTRLFSSTADITTDLQPFLFRMLTPNINPIVVGGSGKEKGTASVRKSSEQTLVKRAVTAMGASGVRFDRVKVSDDNASSFGPQQWIYRMEPPLDTLCTFETAGTSAAKTRYAVRQVLEQEWKKEEARLNEEARLARFGGVLPTAKKADEKRGETLSQKKRIVKDFFGRPIAVPVHEPTKKAAPTTTEPTVWVSYHEGYSNAVRKPLTLAELMKGL